MALGRTLALLLLAAACAAPRSPGLAGPPPAARQPPLPCGPYGDDRPVERTPLEARAWTELQRRLGGLRPSGALDRAARRIAAAAALSDSPPLARQRVQDALRAVGAHDPAPLSHLASGPADEALAALLARVGRTDATVAGLGEHEAGGVHHLVLLLSQRRARLDRFPGAVAAGTEAPLTGELLGLLHPRAFVSRPDGSSVELPLRGGRSFEARIRFDEPGRHSVEVIGTGGRGPEVAALLGVSVGGASCAVAERPAPGPDPDDRAAAEAAVVQAANRTRAAHGLAPLTPEPELSAVARSHSERMLAARKVAHVLPSDGELAGRLAAARIPFRRAFENVASGASALDAHAATEASPAHRANLLTGEADRIGVGVARGALPTGEALVYLTEILVERGGAPDGSRLTHDARVREALWRERARRGLPPLTNDSALEGLARDAAAAMRANDSGELDGLAAGALRMGRELAAADAFIARSHDEALRSRNLTDARFGRVGVGVVVGDSGRFGPARLFIAVLYSN
jgi:uncharacterized protein YkwD